MPGSHSFIWNNTAGQAWNTNNWGRSASPYFPGDTSSSASDTVTIDGANPPTSGPAASLTIKFFVCAGNSFTATANLVVSGVGSYVALGTPGGNDMPVFCGDASGATYCDFCGASQSQALIGNFASYMDHASNYAGYTWNRAGDYAIFSGSAENFGTVGNYAVFTDNAYTVGGSTVGNYATFSGHAYNSGGVVGNGYLITSDHAQSGTFGSTALLPTAAQVQSGVSFGVGQTGTFDPVTGNYTDPGAANVASGATYKFAGSTETGTYDPVTGNYTDPGVGHVQSGTTYKFAGTTETGTYDPVTGNYTDPGIATVWNGTSYKFAGSTLTGTKHASSIANCSAGNVASGVTIDDVTGTYDPLAAAVFPPTNQALTTATYGPTGAEYTGTVDITNATAGNIKSGVTIAGVLGTYDPVTGNYTDPGIDCVESGHTYIFAGVTLTGTYDYAMPDASVVKSGFTMADGTVGDYDPVSGNYSDPGSAWVAAGCTYFFAGQAKVGTYVGPNQDNSQTISTIGAINMGAISLNISASLGGVGLSGTISEDGGGQIGESFSPAAAQAATLTTRTDDHDGVVTTTGTLSGIATGNKVDVFWNDGTTNRVQYNCTATVVGNAVTIAGGSGDALPAASTPVTITKPVAADVRFAGSEVQLLMASSDKLASLTFQDGSGNVLSHITVQPGQCWFWAESLGTANPLASDTVATVAVSCGDPASGANVNLGALYDNTP